MENASSRSLKGRWYAASFLLLLAPVGELSYLFMHPGALSPRALWWTWGGSGASGILCALVGSGGLNRKATDTLGNLALALHISSLALLMLLQALGASAP
jgi:hypothetical protein